MHRGPRDSSVDNLRRDPHDGAYHCPRCEAPFTRRSNLRRHYHIHKRPSDLICHACSEKFSCSDELQVHLLQCSESNWEPTEELHSMGGIDNNGLLDPNFDFAQALGLLDTGNLTASSSSFAHTFLSPLDTFSANSPKMQSIPDSQEFSDVLSLFPCSGVDSPPSPPSSYDATLPSLHTTTAPFAHRRTSSSSSASSTSLSSPSFYPAQNEFFGKLDPRLRSRARSASRYHSTKPAPTPNRGRSRDKPIYTRRQVEDMLDVISSCFVGTMDAVISRTNSPARAETDNPSSNMPFEQGSSSSNDLRRMILSEAFPRMLAGLKEPVLESGSDGHGMIH
ncbi:hypothetical protein BDQ12DRAFT_739531 [Crucibulum laeve]|uniref:C2H2-type domain-containing protein n=1 Tax=Crucibulum laeve TaxID=68775 RepID=A0A5C3LTY0_9AGAR|nr:hypothetical protein BDQ12DRAFT_739531 [Crucibulum laeve]